ncbi:galactokinase [Scatolibacter rhodanostii]|uniref:galactokinase n=1 Tax=Scatolibacter rhodanostii TaxID=2014781 RepID=UPI001FA8DABB|nr:galactokinase family protein [Scatolibacter rhodanostii]
MTIDFKKLYQNEAEEQRVRYKTIKDEFAKQFVNADGIEFFSAPGRTEIGGNHTDHNHGRVLAGAVNLDIVAAARKTEDSKILLKSYEYPGMDIADLSDLSLREEEIGTASALIKGICFKCKELGYHVGGFEAYTISRVLKGSGLSSSAAFEVVIVTIISELYNEGKIDPITTAIIAQYAENVYFGKPSGLLDQMASSVGGVTAIDFKDTANPIVEHIDFDLHSYQHALCIVDTGGNHADLTDEYAYIPAEMKSVAQFFGKEVLREVNPEEFWQNIGEVRQKTGDRAVLRAMHFFDEDILAAEEAQTIKDGDFESFKALINQSGVSSETRLQNVFATLNPSEQGLSLALALSKKFLKGSGACRVHGGGFAGTIQAFVPFDRLNDYRDMIEKVFGKGSCYVLSIRFVGGTKVTVEGV